MTKKELFKEKIVELFNSLLPDNTIDDYSLEIVQTKEHTTLFDLLDSLESSKNPPVCTRETDDAVHVIYPNITFIFPYDFSRVKLFYNSDVKIYIKRPEYVELHQLTDFLCGLDSEMNHWQNMWNYFHDLDTLKLKSGLKEGEKCRKLIEKIEYPFNDRKLEKQRLEYYNIRAARLFIDNEKFDYVCQKSLDTIAETCKAHRIYPDVNEWVKDFDDILEQKRLQYLIAEERKAAIRRKNEKIRHLMSLGLVRLETAVGGIECNDGVGYSIMCHTPVIDMESSHIDLKNEYYYLDVILSGTAKIRLMVPYIKLGEVIGPLVEALNEINALAPKLEEELRGYGNEYMVQRNFASSKPDFGYPLHLVPVNSNLASLMYDFEVQEIKALKSDNLEKINELLIGLISKLRKAG